MEHLHQIAIQEFMTKEVVSLNIEDTLADAYEKMNNHRIRHLPVVNARNEVVGIFTTLDLNRAHSPRETEDGWYYDKTDLKRLSLKHFMTKDPTTLSQDNTLKDAAEIMARERFECIPIVSAKNELVGIITDIDILKEIARHF